LPALVRLFVFVGTGMVSRALSNFYAPRARMTDRQKLHAFGPDREW